MGDGRAGTGKALGERELGQPSAARWGFTLPGMGFSLLVGGGMGRDRLAVLPGCSYWL